MYDDITAISHLISDDVTDRPNVSTYLKPEAPNQRHSIKINLYSIDLVSFVC